ncbi:MAG: hypothetical protein AAF288_14020 [Planctomycetota bacterium]
MPVSLDPRMHAPIRTQRARSAFRIALCVLCALATLPACNQPHVPDIAAIYTQAAQHHGPDRNPVIVIPGILGSKLADDHGQGKLLWGAFGLQYANPDNPDDLRGLALPMTPGAPLSERTDNVRATGALDSVRVDILGLPVDVQAYAPILMTLGVGGYVDQQLVEGGSLGPDYGDDHFTCFQFAYDWRLDNAQNAARLHDYILDRKAYVESELQKRYGHTEPVKFDLVAHSMGGLVARYMLRYGDQPLPEDGSLPDLNWAGAEHVEKVILVGTPSGGSVLSLKQLVEGSRFLPVIGDQYPASLLGTMPAVYQLLPRARHERVVDADTHEPIDVLDPDLWTERQWGLADPGEARVLKRLLPDVASSEERQNIALEHLRLCLQQAQRFHAALDVPAELPDGVSLFLFLGDSEPTPEIVSVSQSRRVKTVETAPGDGTVSRNSALLDERVGRAWTPYLSTPIDWTGVQFMFTDHLGLTSEARFADNVLYLLLEAPRPGRGQLGAPAASPAPEPDA